MRFFPRDRGGGKGKRENSHFQADPRKMANFPMSRGKNRMPQGVENRGSLFSVPLAFRVSEHFSVKLPEQKQLKTNLTTPTPMFVKNLLPKYAIQWGLYGIQVPQNEGISRENMAYGPKTMPPLYAVWTSFIGGGGGLQFVEQRPEVTK